VEVGAEPGYRALAGWQQPGGWPQFGQFIYPPFGPSVCPGPRPPAPLAPWYLAPWYLVPGPLVPGPRPPGSLVPGPYCLSSILF